MTARAWPLPSTAPTAPAWPLTWLKRQIAFFAVPLGERLDPANLHGLVNGSGGKVVRLGLHEGVDALVPRLLETFAEPILYPAKVQWPAEVAEFFPDAVAAPAAATAPTLVVGKLNQAGRPASTTQRGQAAWPARKSPSRLGHAVPAADVDNFFLVNIVQAVVGTPGSAGPDAGRPCPGACLRAEQPGA